LAQVDQAQDNDTQHDGRAHESADHGRQADRPTDIPARGWRDVLVRVKSEAKEDHVTLLSAGVAFYSLLALVPGLVALISIYGLVAQPSTVRSQVVSSLSAAPREVRDLVASQLASIASSSGGSNVITAVVGIILALWSASAGVGHVMDALNVTYDEEEGRSFIRRKAIALLFTIGAVLFFVVAFAVIAIMPAALADTGLGAVGRILANVLRWVILFGGMIVGLAILYRYAPDRDEPQWRWASPGAIVAAILWTIGSIAFSIYTANFGKYNETYGSLAAIVVVMLWLFLTALAVLLGGEVNSELERQTAKDTTAGPPDALGSRGAYAADTVGPDAEEMRAGRSHRS
jgi:membrane protein